MKFLEKWIDSFVSDLSGRSFYLNKFVPLEMRYTIQANHHHDYDHKWGDVILRGQAVGELTGDELRAALRGEVLRFETPVGATSTSSGTQSRSFASWKEFQEFETRFNTVRRRGCYWVNISFGGSADHGTPAEQRQRYRGIDRSGSSPIHPDPDADFLRVMPAYMPDGTNVYGCLDKPEQTEAQGGLTFPTDPGPLNSPGQISIKWSFVRNLCRAGMACS